MAGEWISYFTLIGFVTVGMALIVCGVWLADWLGRVHDCVKDFEKRKKERVR